MSSGRITARQHRASRFGAEHRSRPRARLGQKSFTLAAILGLAAGGIAACSSSPNTSPSASASTIKFTDEAGRVVQVPARITRVVTIGFLTGLDSFLYMVDAQSLIVNGIPSAGAPSTFLRPYRALAPRLLSLPKVQPDVGTDTFNKEELLSLSPSVVITSSPALAGQVQTLGIPAVVVDDFSSGSAIEHDVTVVGKLVNHQSATAAYIDYYNNIISEARAGGASIPAARRPTALYADFGPLTQPTPVEAWAFGILGVHNVVPAGVPNHYGFSDEQVYKWNPGYIVVQRPADLPQFTKGAAFANLPAVKDGHVREIPSGFNIWGDNTVEEPLGLLWTAQYIYPKQFAYINLPQQVQMFYSRFFHVTLTSAQVTHLLENQGLS